VRIQTQDDLSDADKISVLTKPEDLGRDRNGRVSKAHPQNARDGATLSVMSVLTAVAQPPDDPFGNLDELTDELTNRAIQRDVRQVQKNLAEIRRQLLILEIDADYRRMFPPICVPNRRHL
jgi:hypothetical protein